MNKTRFDSTSRALGMKDETRFQDKENQATIFKNKFLITVNIRILKLRNHFHK